MRQPIEDINAMLLEDGASKDGSAEPLEIRDVATRRTHSRDVARKLWAALGEGNVADRHGSDMFVLIVKDSDVRVGGFPMVDNSDNFGDVKTIAENLSPDDRRIGPFVEGYAKKGVVSSLSMESDMITALTDMDPGTENMVPIGYSQLGSTGFDY
jgi:hypothetical protein